MGYFSYPEVPTCADCEQWMYDIERGWELKRIPPKTGLPMARPKGVKTPCHSCPKSGDGQPHPEKDLTDRNWQALDYFYQCEADTTGLLPRDRRVVHNNAMIHRIRERIRDGRADISPMLISMLAARKEK